MGSEAESRRAHCGPSIDPFLELERVHDDGGEVNQEVMTSKQFCRPGGVAEALSEYYLWDASENPTSR